MLKLNNSIHMTPNNLISANGGSCSTPVRSPQQTATEVRANRSTVDVGQSQEMIFCQPELSLVMPASNNQTIHAQQLPSLVYQTIQDPSPVQNAGFNIQSPENLKPIPPHGTGAHAPTGDYVIIQEVSSMKKGFVLNGC